MLCATIRVAVLIRVLYMADGPEHFGFVVLGDKRNWCYIPSKFLSFELNSHYILE